MERHVSYRNHALVRLELLKQLECASCWAAVAVSCAKGAYDLHREPGSPPLPCLAIQDILDHCHEQYKFPECYGCKGGLVKEALRFIKNYGAHFEGDYAYRAKTPHDFEIPAIPRQKDIVDGIGRVGAKDTPATLDQVIRALQKAGPLAVELEIGRFKDFSQMHRDDPVFRGPWGFDNPEISGNHAVLLVGTCEDLQGRPCFEMQNSWGTDFCDEGFFKIQQSDLPHFAHRIFYARKLSN